MEHANVIAAGFGRRLKEERKRLKLSQAQLAELAQIKRLAQSQYEIEATVPTIRYLSAIAAAGVDLTYLLFGIRPNKSLPPEEERQLKIRAFSLLEKYVQNQCGGRLGPEVRAAIFDVILGLLSNAARKGTVPEDREVLDILSHR